MANNKIPKIISKYSFLYKILLITFLSVSIVNTKLVFANKVYTCNDADGNIVFTDSTKPISGCVTTPKEKNIKPLPKYESNNSSSSFNSNSDSQSDIRYSNDPEDINNITSNLDQPTTQQNNYNTIEITSPTSNKTINHCGGLLTVAYSSSPGLYSGDIAELHIDGSKVTVSTSSSFTVNNVDRGDHNLTVKISRNGSIIASSNPVYFTFLRNCFKKSEVQQLPDTDKTKIVISGDTNEIINNIIDSISNDQSENTQSNNSE